MEQITKEMCRELLPPRLETGHKGTFGKVGVIGGAVGYTGAPVYAGEAAVRTGSGLVYVGVPEPVYPIVASRCAASMVFPLPADYDALLEQISGWDAVLVGPGLGRSVGAETLVLRLLEDLETPVVLDADGINAAAEHMDILRRRSAPTVVTPHQVEFARMGGDLSPGRWEAARQFAADSGCVTVLKGPGTVVADPAGRAARNTTGSSALAKGGSGDVLAGVLLSLAGQGAPLWEAAALAVWLHGRAGDLCKERLTDYGVTPLDLVEAIPGAIRELLE